MEPTNKVLVPVPEGYANKDESERLSIAGGLATTIQEALA